MNSSTKDAAPVSLAALERDFLLDPAREERAARIFEQVSRIAARVLVTAAYTAGTSRFRGAIERALGNDWNIDTVASKQADTLLKSLTRADKKRLAANLSAALIRGYIEAADRMVAEEGLYWHRDTSRETAQAASRKNTRIVLSAMEKFGDETEREVIADFAYRLVEDDLARHRLHECSLEHIVSLLRPEAGATFTLATNPIATAMTRSLIHRSVLDEPFDTPVQMRDGGRQRQLTVRASVSLESLLGDGVKIASQAEVLGNIYRQLAYHKDQAAALVKMHVDLMNEAYRAGGDFPLIAYDLTAAAERLGFKRSGTRRGFHPKTLQAMRERLVTLTVHYVEVLSTDRQGRAPDEGVAVPYWKVEGIRYEKQDQVPFLGRAVLLHEKSAPHVTRILIQPGRWWSMAEMDKYRIEIPRALLALPVDGKGRELERMAVLAAVFLGIHVRINQNRAAGDRVDITTGVLLDRAGIITWSEFEAMHRVTANRLRGYLYNTDGVRGALLLLRDMAAFDIDVVDEDEFYASGHDWREKFWNSKLRVAVRDLGVPKPAALPKRTRRRRA
jgi:hypothetical protein